MKTKLFFGRIPIVAQSQPKYPKGIKQGNQEWAPNPRQTRHLVRGQVESWPVPGGSRPIVLLLTPFRSDSIIYRKRVGHILSRFVGNPPGQSSTPVVSKRNL